MHSGFSAIALICLASLASLTDVAIADESEDCPPAAVLSGDDSLRAELRIDLAIRGVFTENIPVGCPVVRVTLTQDENTVSVAVLAQGRRAVRELSNSQTAAIWIETWARDDLEAPLLTARPVLAASSLGLVTPSPQPTSLNSTRGTELSTVGERRPIMLVPSFEIFDGNDDSKWRALRLAACWKIGFACAGGALGLADNLGYSHNSELSFVNRRAAQIQATVGFPIPIGQATAEPSVGLGLDLLNTRRAHKDCSANCPAEPTEVDDGFTRTSVEPIVEGRLTLSFVISHWLSFEISGAIILRPFGNQQALLPDSLSTETPTGDPADPNGPADPSGESPDGGGPNGGPNEESPFPLAAYELPGEPTRALGIGIGVRISL